MKFRAEMNAGYFILHKDGFTVLQSDTSDLKRIHKLLHGELPNALVPSASGKSVAYIQPGLATSGGGRTIGKGVGGGGVGSGNPAGGNGDPFLLHSQTYRVTFMGANEQVVISPEKVVASYINYFVGASSQWRPQTRIYQGVVYKDLYPGIDLHYYSDGGFLKYDLVVHPGADPNQIVLRYQGQDKLSIRKGQLWVQTSVGTVKELEPRSYQLTGQGRTAVNCSYSMPDANTVRFKIKEYSPDATLVIDPTESFCTFTGSKSDNWGYTATYDNSGNFYVGGIVLDYPGIFSGTGFLTTPRAFQSTFQGGGDGLEGTYNDGSGQNPPYSYDVAIMKFNSVGSAVLFATYLGGSGEEQPHSMICDPQGNLIVTGRTSSSNFPVFPAGATDHQGAGFDIFITKFNINGTGLIGSRRIGGEAADGVNYKPKYVLPLDGTQELRLSYGDDGRGEVILDAANNIYVATCTQSLHLPTTPGAFQPGPGNPAGGQDGVVIKTSADVSTVLGISYLGGSGTDAAFVLALNPANNNIYVAGGTMSTDFPGVGKGPAVSPANNGGADGFVSIISNDLSTLINTSYFGTSGTDMIYGIEFDNSGFPYITGTTTGSWAVTPGVGFTQQNGRQFISKLRPDLSGYIYSMTFGKGDIYPDISPTAFLVDRCENVYVAGWGGGIDQGEKYNNSRTTGLRTTANALQPNTDGDDFYFFVLQKNAASQLYGSFFGQQGGMLGDHVDGGTSRFDKQGVIYQSICANCYGGATFPTTPGAIYRTNGTGTQGCNEAAVKIKFDFAGVSAGLKLALHGRGDSVGCTPLLVGLQDTVLNAKSYIWDFGDGVRDTTTSSSLTHSYTAVGVYTVMLIGIDSNSCNVADTVYRTITVKNNPATLAFDITKLPPCTSFDYLFDNQSTHTPLSPPFTNISFIWNFGDGSGNFPAGLGNTNHSYKAPGPYTVQLILVDTNYCNYPDTLAIPFYVAQNVKAQFKTPSFGCAPYTAVFNNTSIAGSKYYWDFGDGSPVDSVDVSPTHLYTNIGPYTITLIAVDSNTCNISDTTTFQLTVQGKPTAGFTFTPSPPTPNTPTIFTDASSPAVKYQWSFGDGHSETKLTPDTVMHQYNKTDTFQVCLVVTNESGCTDTVCHPVPAIINPLLDVPNAFTPGRFGQNGIVKVVGFGITHMAFRIYNRWGQLLFESNDPYFGWDGTYRGTLQPMDVYGYTLEAEFSDGTHASKKGDITLIR